MNFIRKCVTTLLVGIAISAYAFDPDKELKGGQVVNQVMCSGKGDPTVYLCVAVVAKDGKRYLVQFDEEGMAKMYSVANKEELTEDDFTLVWSRPGVADGKKGHNV